MASIFSSTDYPNKSFLDPLCCDSSDMFFSRQPAIDTNHKSSLKGHRIIMIIMIIIILIIIKKKASLIRLDTVWLQSTFYLSIILIFFLKRVIFFHVCTCLCLSIGRNSLLSPSISKEKGNGNGIGKGIKDLVLAANRKRAIPLSPTDPVDIDMGQLNV